MTNYRRRHERHLRVRPEPRVLTWLEALTDDVAITTITLAELLAGVGRLPDGRRKLDLRAAIDDAIWPYREMKSLLAFDEAAAAEHSAVLVVRERAGLPIRMADAQVAAICKVHSAVGATRNTKDFALTKGPAGRPLERVMSGERGQIRRE